MKALNYERCVHNKPSTEISEKTYICHRGQTHANTYALNKQEPKKAELKKILKCGLKNNNIGLSNANVQRVH